MKDVRLQTENLSVGYNGKALIREIVLSLHPGEIMTLIGPNGAGKSTILKSIIRQLALVRGTVRLDGRDMAGLTEGELSRSVSVLMTAHIHPELMTCFDVAATGRYPYTGRLGILTREDREKVAQCLALVHASDLADQDFSRISDGQRQRVLLARALCQEPEVLVLDEPTSFLDIRHKLELLAILKDMVRTRHLAVLMSLHELDLAQKVSDYVVCVRGDAVERQGPPEEIFTPDYIMSLYGAARGSYNALFGSLELEAVSGAPEVFVIGGGGAGITGSSSGRGSPSLPGSSRRTTWTTLRPRPWPQRSSRRNPSSRWVKLPSGRRRRLWPGAAGYCAQWSDSDP